MSTFKGTARTVRELIAILEQFPPDKPIRMKSISHEWPVDVHEHMRCIMLDM